MQKHKTFRERHPERVKAASRASYEKYRDVYLQTKRERYELQKEDFKQDVKQCPICQINYRRTYLKKHMLNRHKMSEEELPTDLCCKPVILKT